MPIVFDPRFCNNVSEQDCHRSKGVVKLSTQCLVFDFKEFEISFPNEIVLLA